MIHNNRPVYCEVHGCKNIVKKLDIMLIINKKTDIEACRLMSVGVGWKMKSYEIQRNSNRYMMSES